MFDPLTFLAAAMPLISHAGGAVIDLVKDHYAPDELKPTNVEEYVQLSKAKLDLFKAMNEVGGVSYPWVEAIIKLQRPVVVLVVILTWGYFHCIAPAATDTGAIDNAAGIVGSFLFADRSLFYARKK
jgi:hypothetical protein